MLRSIKDVFSDRPTKEIYEEDLYRVKKVVYKKDDMYLLKKMFKIRPTRVGSKKNLFSSGGFGGGGKGFVNQKDQRVTFKVSHSKSIQAHNKYLKTYMPQENKKSVEKKPRLFGTPDSLYEKKKVKEHFKFIISPENQNVNLEVLSSEFIKRLEVMTGYKLLWKGAIHTDTEHRHAHLCINGKDENGKKVYFQKEMIKQTMRETLSYIATQLVGERTENEILNARKNSIISKRWINLDEVIEKNKDSSGRLSVNLLSNDVKNRIAFLVQLNLAEDKKGYFKLKDDWKDVLVATGRYNTFFEEWQKSNGNLELYSGGSIKGKVERVISFDKDESWNDALVINENGKRVYVPVWQLNKEDLLGKTVEISGGNKKLSRQVTDKSIKICENQNNENDIEI